MKNSPATKMYKTFTLIISCLPFMLGSCGQASKVEVRKVITDTSYIEYYANGQEKIVSEYRNGKQDGSVLIYNEEGRLLQIGSMVEGIKDGTWKDFDENGKLKRVYFMLEDTVYRDLELSDFQFVEHKLGKTGKQVYVPREWEIIPEKSTLLILRKKCPETTTFCPNLVLTAGRAEFGTPEESANQLHKLLAAQTKGLRVIQANWLTIHGHKAYEIVYKYMVDEQNLANVVTLIFGYECVYVFIGSASNEPFGEFIKYRDVFRNVIASFRNS